MNRKNIILIGMPGSGKSTCGVLAAKALLKNFYDTDLLLQGIEERRLQEIIDTEGTEYFLRLEEEALSGLSLEATVVATGGSVIYSERAMQNLKKNAMVIYLHLSFESMVSRIDNISTRGVVMKKGATLESMYNERLPLYSRWADITIDCDDKSVEEVVEQIVKAVNV